MQDLSEKTTEIDTLQTDYLNKTYPVMEHFYTIQGEGAFTGYPAYFIRFGGCDVQCWWCDVKDSWDESIHPRIAVSELLEAVLASKANIVVITGGEPALQDLVPITEVLRTNGLRVHIETSGSSPLTGTFDWVTVSPKRFKEPIESVYPFVSELKVVILRKKDFEFAEKHAALCKKGIRLLLQPEWESQERAVPLVIDYVMKHPQWTISLQTHKFIGVR